MAIFAPDERLPSSATLISCENYLWANDDDDGDDVDGAGGDDGDVGDSDGFDSDGDDIFLRRSSFSSGYINCSTDDASNKIHVGIIWDLDIKQSIKV